VQIDAPVFVESAVLDCNHRLLKLKRNLLYRNVIAPFNAELMNKVAIFAQNPRYQRLLNVLHLTERGEGKIKPEEEPESACRYHRYKKENEAGQEENKAAPDLLRLRPLLRLPAWRLLRQRSGRWEDQECPFTSKKIHPIEA
jgi:hypothetical protein